MPFFPKSKRFLKIDRSVKIRKWPIPRSNVGAGLAEHYDDVLRWYKLKFLIFVLGVVQRSYEHTRILTPRSYLHTYIHIYIHTYQCSLVRTMYVCLHSGDTYFHYSGLWGEKKTLGLISIPETGISSGQMSHLARMQAIHTLYLLLSTGVYLVLYFFRKAGVRLH